MQHCTKVGGKPSAHVPFSFSVGFPKGRSYSLSTLHLAEVDAHRF